MTTTARPRVALVYDRIYPLLNGGGERRFYEIARRISIDYDVAFFYYGHGASPNPFPNYAPVGVGGRMSMYTPQGRRSIAQSMDFAARLAKPLMDFEPHFIDCSSVSYAAIPVCAAAAARTGAAFFITWHEFWDRYWSKYLPPVVATVARSFERFVPRLATTNVAVSRFTAARLARGAGVTAHVIQNGVDVAAIDRVKPSPQTTDVLFVGRLIKEKRVDLLLESARLLSQTLDRLRVTIVGEGPEEHMVRQHASTLPANITVELVPSIALEADLYARMKSAKMLVLPSEREGYGLVVAEAQACGTVPVVVDAPDSAAADLVEHERTGLITAPRARDLADAIARLLTHAELRRALGSAALQMSSSRDWDSTAQATASLFQRVRAEVPGTLRPEGVPW